jgi:hypothetical protein
MISHHTINKPFEYLRPASCRMLILKCQGGIQLFIIELWDMLWLQTGHNVMVRPSDLPLCFSTSEVTGAGALVFFPTAYRCTRIRCSELKPASSARTGNQSLTPEDLAPTKVDLK